ncbi:putative peptidoglycan binding protein [Motilibacter rhizosphaerae]|uniref:Putative peptidoglycan binding protein n=1 Tax=Motilibacter rhizosphaerae TaxID=598652 RepID=A0A4V2F4G9_9ACTN|nr:peptidoglycan-binding protein [Motilibacter rhizosphaerae]RZS87567.1 putative peptidoglycan binding protein [Motilibacter rhizosphaerae]
MLLRKCRALAALLLAAAATAAVALPAAPASARSTSGGDVSWPQCTEHPGHGLPPPGKGTGFVVMGLTSGLPFTENPCIDRQLAHTRAIGARLAVYTFAAMPTPVQLRELGPSGPYDGGTRLGALGNVGYAQGAWAVSVVRGRGVQVPVVWLDVEHRKVQDWAHDTAANRAVLLGAVRALQEAGFGVGFYSYAYGWREITGGMRSELPVWATAGRRGRAGALAMCHQASFSGGPVVLTQWYDDVRDSDALCPTLARPVSVESDDLRTYAGLVLKRGSHGPAVAALRRRLGIAPAPQFSRATALAVRRFQRAHHLAVDGVVGPVTWRALGVAPLPVRVPGPVWDRWFGTP